jgi:release factor glutamine methyltransferase
VHLRDSGRRAIGLRSQYRLFNGDKPMLDRSPLTALLENAITKKPHPSMFAAGYQDTLEAVDRGGTFSLAGLELTVPRGVYPPRPGSSTEFFCRNWSAAGLSEPTGSLLELGCGSGALTLHAARLGWRATGSDIDETAVRTAQRNAMRNALDAEFVCSDLFAAFEDRRFDVIIFNQPFVHKPMVHAEEKTLASANGDLSRRFLDEAAHYLRPGGKLVFSYSNCSDDRLLDRRDWSIELVACDYDALGQYWRVVLVARPN